MIAPAHTHRQPSSKQRMSARASQVSTCCPLSTAVGIGHLTLLRPSWLLIRLLELRGRGLSPKLSCQPGRSRCSTSTGAVKTKCTSCAREHPSGERRLPSHLEGSSRLMNGLSNTISARTLGCQLKWQRGQRGQRGRDGQSMASRLDSVLTG